MKLELALALLVAPALAHAGGHHCHEVSDVVGYEQCGAFGGWRYGATLAWELGVSALRYSREQIDAMQNIPLADGTTQTYHVHAAAGDPRSVTAMGGRLRAAIGFGRTFYIVSQTDLESVTGGPHLVADVSAHGTTTTMDTASSGFIMQGAFLLGAHRHFGVFSLSLESGLGVRSATYSATDLPRTVQPPMQFTLLVPVQPKLDLWLSPNCSFGLVAGIDALHPDGVFGGLVLGLHVMPYDASR